MSTFPIFGVNGPEGELDVRTPRTPDGFQPRGQGAPVESEYFHFRDPAREAEEKERRIDELFRLANPALYDARLKLQLRQRTTAGFLRQIHELREAMALPSISPDAPIGVAAERAFRLRTLQEQLKELEAEAAAALEEQQQAQQVVDALIQVSA